MTGGVGLSVIVPVYRGGEAFRQCLGALRSSEGMESGSWELVAVIDGHDPDSAAVAQRFADRVAKVENGPRGPANARNLGAELARGEVLVFVDADVLVHPDTLVRIRDLFAGDPGLAAAFGAYDDRPAHPGFFSQYRNLYHRYVHLMNAGQAETFWAGCGAVRADAFRAVGGFDADAYPRPQIEDIELGYRLRAAGGRIALDPSIQGKHLKRWTLANIVRTDLLDRGVPWMRLILRWDRAGARRAESLGVRSLEKVKTGLLGLGLLALAVGGVLGRPLWVAAGGALPVAVVLLSWPVYAWFGRLRGWGFAIRVIPMDLLHYLVSGCCVVLAWIMEALRPGALTPTNPLSREGPA